MSTQAMPRQQKQLGEISRSSAWWCAVCGYALLDEPNWQTHQEWHRREGVRAEYAEADAEIEGRAKPRTPKWRWMNGRTVQALGGGYIARIHRESAGSQEPPPHPLAVRIARRWEIEGYGTTPDEAIADLTRRFKR